MPRVVLLALVVGALVFGLWSRLLDRPLWHDEEQIAFAARQLIETGDWRHFTDKAIVGENISHPLDTDGKLAVMSPAEIWLAAAGYRITESWRRARIPFAVAGALAGLLLALLCARVTGVAAAGFCALALWLMIPWTWTLSVQLRYYPLCWLVLLLVLWSREHRWPSLVTAGCLFVMHLVNWVLMPVALLVLAVRERNDPTKRVLRWWSILIPLALAVVVHMFVLTGQGMAALSLGDKNQPVLWIFGRHLAEFNLDVFPLLLLGVLLIYAGPRERPWVLSALVVPLMLVVPSFYTRLALMFLPLFVLAFVVVLTQLSRQRPWLGSLVLMLFLVTGFWSSTPAIVCEAFSPTLGRQWMPLNRTVEGVLGNPRRSWEQVLAGPDTTLDQLVDVIEGETKQTEGIICAVDGTGLQRRTGRPFHWKRQGWMEKQVVPSWLESPVGVRLVIVRRQWPWQSRETTWTTEIVQAIEQGWLPAQQLETGIIEYRLWTSPFPYAQERQAWPEMSELEIWKLDHPLTNIEAKRLKTLEPTVLRPGVVIGDPDVMFGYPR